MKNKTMGKAAARYPHTAEAAMEQRVKVQAATSSVTETSVSPAIPDEPASFLSRVKLISECTFKDDDCLQLWCQPPTEHEQCSCPVEEHQPHQAELAFLQLPVEDRARTLADTVYCDYSDYCGVGVFAKKSLQRDSVVGEYVGHVWEEDEFNAAKPEGHYGYLVECSGCVVDAEEQGNALRYINHSCEPNCQARQIYCQGRWHVIVSALADIRPDEELRFDYHLTAFESDDWHLLILCECGSKQCRGTLYTLVE